MRTGSAESRSRYLSLALASRNLMKQLDTFAETGERSERMLSAVSDLMRILDTTWQTSNSFAPVPGQSPFGRYEQALTINELAAHFDADKVRERLSGIFGGTVSAPDRKDVATKVGDFLYSLENRALHNYSEQFDERGD